MCAGRCRLKAMRGALPLLLGLVRCTAVQLDAAAAVGVAERLDELGRPRSVSRGGRWSRAAPPACLPGSLAPERRRGGTWRVAGHVAPDAACLTLNLGVLAI